MSDDELVAQYRASGSLAALSDQALQREYRRARTEALKARDPGEYDPASPQFRERYGATSGMGHGARAWAGTQKAVVDMGRGLRQVAAEAGNRFGLVDDSTVQGLRERQDEVNARDADLLRTGAGAAGYLAGNIASIAMPGAAAARGAQALHLGRAAAAARMLTAPRTIAQGALSGAAIGAASPLGTGQSRGDSALLGGLAGAAGTAVANSLGRVLRPTAAPEASRAALVREAQARGLPLGVEDLTGSKPLQVTASVLGNIPGSAGREAALRRAKQEALNRAVAATVGERGATRITPEVLAQARQRLGGEFQRLSDDRVAQLGSDLLDALVDVDSAQAPLRGILDTSRIDRLVNGALDLAARGQVKGRTAQTIRSELTKAAKDAARSDHSRLAMALRRVRDGFDDSIRNGLSGEERAAWDLAREQWGNLRTIEKALANAPGAASGDVSGSALLNAIGRNADRPLSRMESELKTLGVLGREFVGSPIPDSGTAQRTMVQNLIGMGGQAAMGGMLGGVVSGGDPTAALVGAAALPLGARVAQPVLRSQLTARYLSQGVGPRLTPRQAEIARLLQQLSGPAGASAALTYQR